MKHFYNANTVAATLQPTATGLETAWSSKIFAILLLAFFLLVSGKGMAQTITGVNTNCALEGEDVTLTITGSGFRSNASDGASRVIINGSTSVIEPSFITTTSITAFVPKNLIDGTSFTVSIIQKGNGQTEVISSPFTANVIPLIATPGQSCDPGTVLLTASGAPSGLGFEYRWYDATFAQVGTGSSFTTPTLNTTTTYYVSVASSTCESTLIPVKATIGSIEPIVTGDRRCNAGDVTLTASGAPAGAIYNWYTAPTGGTPLYTGSVYTPNVSSTTTYYVGIESSATCANPRVPVTATIGSINAPTVSASVNCNATGAQVITFYASGATNANDVYTWYDNGDVVAGYGASIQRTTNQNSGLHYVVITSGTCTSDRTYLVVPSNNKLVPDAPTSFSAEVCPGGSLVLAPPIELGMTYRWYDQNGNQLTDGDAYTIQSVKANTTYQFSKINVATRCESATRATATVTVTSPIAATGTIVEPVNPVVGQPATFGYTSNIPAIEIESYQWYYHEVGSSPTNWVLSGNASELSFEEMPGNIDGVRVELKVREQNASCYSNLIGVRTYLIGNSTITPLPVELVSFKAQRHAQGVNLMWVTASEQDNSGFEVQVSTDSKTFEKIGFVESKVGTTSIKQNYSFLDTKAVSGTRYYRLKQIDLDGTTAYSSIQAVALDGGNGQVAAYPNPFEDVVTVRLNGTEPRKVKTILSTAHGLIILQREVETSGNTITIDTSHVTAKGIYILHVMESDGTKHTIKLLKE